MIRKYIIEADDSIKGFDEGITRLEREWGAEEIEPSEDAISRDAVMKCFEKWQPYMATRILGYEQELSQLPSVTPQQTRWIPCSERLPERDVNVLTYHRDVAFDYQYVSWIDDYSGKWAGFIGNLSDEVLAWMPLPEDYKEVEK
jgi:hypothetical protein